MANTVEVVLKFTDEGSSKLKDLSGAAEESKISFSELNQALEVGSKAVELLKQGYDNTVGAFQTYAQQVRDLKAISGESAESTSRFIQVLDDYQVSAEDAMTATRALTKQGLAPNIDTLAQLSDKYLAITDVQERNKFVIDNLGRAGLQWNQVLAQGSDALRAQAAAVDANLILDQQMLDRAEQLRMQQDKLNDTMEGFKIVIGEKLTPAMSAWLEMLSRALDGTLKWRDGAERFTPIFGGLINLTETYGDVFNELSTKMSGAAAEQDNAAQSAADLAKAEKEASEVFQTELGLMTSLQDQTNSYNKSQADTTKQIDDTKKKLAEALAQGWWPTSDKVKGLQGELDDLRKKYAEQADASTIATNKILYNNLMQKASQDGVVSDLEFQMLQRAGVALGIFSDKTADNAIKMNALTDAVSTGKLSVDHLGEAIRSLPSGKSVDVIINTIVNAANGTTSGHADNTGQGAAQAWQQSNKHAQGVFSSPGGQAIVGEFGPEAVMLPAGAMVKPAAETNASQTQAPSKDNSAAMLSALTNVQATLSMLPDSISRALRQNERYVR